MSAKNPALRQAAARAGAATRWGNNPDAARRELAAERIADHIQRVVAEAPPLTPEQTDRLANLLRGAL